ncbi:hypothetical protein [Methylobacterium aquaticum]|uniref:Uncharacterized protein n=1 Tax=Methylobacterium aquaticum TaxID=270351 RepID=A0A0C6FH20_9HYPH|nr:hypothetical protein [Methylobacterium aquaticum]BAQ44369.1 hypothetical protein Maq22A_c04815 [Methylobacterium aquaticum]
MSTVSDLIAKWPSISDWARDLGLRPSHGTVIKHRGSIPVAYWPKMIAAAEQRGINGVTYEALALIHAAAARAEAGAA